MRTRRLTTVVIFVALALAACDGGDGPSRDETPEPARLTLWTANLEHLLPEHDWTVFVDRVAARSRPPDLLFLSELTSDEATTVVDALSDDLDTAYAFEHAPIGDNAIVWSTDRFGEEPDDAPLLWEPWGSRGCRAPSESDPSEVIGVRLDDRLSASPVVAVAVHWGRTWAAACMEKNLSSLNELIEQQWGDRPLTVVAGDLNAHPDKRPAPGAPEAEDLDSGRETDPDCWYRAFSALHDEELAVSRPTEDDRDCANDPYYSQDADSYYDAVSVVNEGGSLCDQWTSIHGAPAAEGSSCTDTNGDGLRDRGRIDYIWVRWEDRGGEPLLPPSLIPADQIVVAAADPICIIDACSETRYSDHRAVFAEVVVEPAP